MTECIDVLVYVFKLLKTLSCDERADTFVPPRQRCSQTEMSLLLEKPRLTKTDDFFNKLESSVNAIAISKI